MQANQEIAEYRVDTRLPGPRSQSTNIGREDAFFCADEIRILVIDDDPSICKMIKTAFGRHEFKIDTISDSSHIESTLRRDSYQLLVLDYVLPGLEWSSVLEWIKETQRDAGLIVVTAHPSVDSVLNCLRAKTYDYLTKPFSINTLQSAVQRCLQSKGLMRLSEAALRENLGIAIRERRKALNLTLAQMTRRTGVSLGYLSQIELGKNSASIETLYRICLGLGRKLSEIFLEVQNME